MTPRIQHKVREWLKRYIPAEIVGTALALIFAWIAYNQTHSYAVAAASGWVGEGIGFFGYFVTSELVQNAKKYAKYPLLKRIRLVIATASTNLIVEFLPAEIIDNLIIRPFAMFIVPQYIHPYPVGFLVGKLGADVFFYLFATIGYEIRKRMINISRE